MNGVLARRVLYFPHTVGPTEINACGGGQQVHDMMVSDGRERSNRSTSQSSAQESLGFSCGERSIQNLHRSASKPPGFSRGRCHIRAFWATHGL